MSVDQINQLKFIFRPQRSIEIKKKEKLEKAAQGEAQCEVSAYAPSCRRCVAVATYWKDQTRRAQNCKYLR